MNGQQTGKRVKLSTIIVGDLFVGAIFSVIVSWKHGALEGVVAQMLLSCLCLLLGSLLISVQLRWRERYTGGMSKLIMLAAAGVVVSQASFLALVWSGEWRTWAVVWKIWWGSMVPSVFLTHLLLIRPADRAMTTIEKLASVCVVWAGLMIGYLGVRGDMFANIPTWYLIVGAVPAAGTIGLSLYLLLARLFARVAPAAVGKRSLVAGILLTHLVAAVVGFYIGRATKESAHKLPDNPYRGVKSIPGQVAQQADADMYETMSGVAEYLGDTRLVGRDPFITFEQIDEIAAQLKPGDIILERRNWYLSNPWLPGFWPHSAIYIGTLDDLVKLGIADDPAVLQHLAEYTAPAADGQPHTIIEAVSEGVVFNSLHHSLHADYVAILRPRLSEKQIATAIARAIGHLHKPYDFNFDFADTEKLVCTQLVYLSYKDMLDIDLVQVMGRTTLPALEWARKYVTQADSPDRQLDFVLFLDGDATTNTANLATESDFRKSIHRPRALVER